MQTHWNLGIKLFSADYEYQCTNGACRSEKLWRRIKFKQAFQIIKSENLLAYLMSVMSEKKINVYSE